MPSGQLDGHRVIFERAKGPIGLNDGPPILTVILRNRRPAARSNHDVHVRYRRFSDREHPITKSTFGIERHRDRTAALDDITFHGIFRKPAHPIGRTAEHRQAREVGQERTFETKIAVAPYPCASYAHGQRQRWLLG